jgi:hypothetical protein
MDTGTLRPIQFYDQPIQPVFKVAPLHEKSPDCPDAFTWKDEFHAIVEQLAEWHDFTRRGRSARNMQPAHAAVAAGRGSLGVGRFYFRVRVASGRIFDIYYDRAPKDADHRKGEWFLYRELRSGDDSGI